MPAALFVFTGKWWCLQCSDLFKLFVNGKFTECFHFPILWLFPLCLMHVSNRFCLSSVTSPWPLIFSCAFSMSLISRGVLCIQEHPLKKCFARLDLLFIIFLSAHFQIKSTATIKLLHHFGFVCMLILGYALHIFHTTDAKYAMFCIGWCKSLKGSLTPDTLDWFVKQIV